MPLRLWAILGWQVLFALFMHVQILVVLMIMDADAFSLLRVSRLSCIYILALPLVAHPAGLTCPVACWLGRGLVAPNLQKYHHIYFEIFLKSSMRL